MHHLTQTSARRSFRVHVTDPARGGYCCAHIALQVAWVFPRFSQPELGNADVSEDRPGGKPGRPRSYESDLDLFRKANAKWQAFLQAAAPGDFRIKPVGGDQYQGDHAIRFARRVSPHNGFRLAGSETGIRRLAFSRSGWHLRAGRDL